MGNRAIVHFTTNEGDIRKGVMYRTPAGFSVYQHWGADDLRAWLKEAAPSLRTGDAGYAAARWIGFLCQHKYPLDGNGHGYSVGLSEDAFDPQNGLYVVDCSTGRVTCYRENREGHYARSGRSFTLKMGQF